MKQSRKLFRTALALVLALCLVAQTGLVSFAEPAANTAPSAPTGLLMDLMEVPMGIDSENPALSWIVNDADQNEVQTAYQVLVASTKANIDADIGDVWDSGKIVSSESSNALYAGPALEANSGYYWKVRTWDKDDAVSPYSEAQAFTTAVGDNWTADSIWVGEGTPDNAFTRLGWTDYIIDCDFTVTSKALGFSFRTDNAESNCYMWQIRSDRDVLVPHVFTNGSANIDSGKDGSSDFPLGMDIVEGTTYHLTLSAIGNTVTTKINDTVVDTREIKNYSCGSIGFRCGGSESGTVSNLKVTKPDGTVLYENNFASAEDALPTTTVSNGVMTVPNNARAYYVVSDGGSSSVSSDRGNVIFARRSFNVDKEVERAIVSVTARYPGFKGSSTTRQYAFKLSVNGEYVGIGPHMDGYADKYFYNTFDVTDKLVQGENAIGAIVYVLKEKMFMAQLKIDYTDGTSETIKTDDSWMTLDGTAAFGEGNGSIGTSYFTAMCENIDARVYPYGFDEAGFDDSKWVAPVIKDQITNLVPTPTDPVLQNFVTPAKVVDKGNGNYFIDLGKEIIGGIRLTVDGVDGAQLTMLYGEELSGENTVRWQMRTGNNYREYFTLKDGPQIIENFGMKNYRYIEIQNSPVAITADNVRGVALHQKFDDSESYFTSDNQILNDIYDFCKYSLKVTTQDLYVDSQSRERGPYEGDAYVNQLSHYAFSRNYNVARFSNEFLAYHEEWCSEYKLQNIMSFWEDYLYTGNLESIENFYSVLPPKLTVNLSGASWNDALKLINYGSSNNLVDWPAGERDGYQFSNYNTVINAYNYKAALDLASMAELLGKNDDVAQFNTLAADLKVGLNGLYNEETGKMVDGRDGSGNLLTHSAQHASFVPLAMGVITDADKVEALTSYLEQDGIKCSVYATQYLLDGLYAAGKGQAALNMLTSTGKRSWAHLIYDLGATVASEAWDPGLKGNMTYSHAWGSSPGNVIIRDLCGIKPAEAGYSKIQVMPQIGDLETVSVKVPNIKGYVYMDIDRTAQGYVTDMSVTIPANSTAKVYVPADGTDVNLLVVDGQTITATREGSYLVVDNVGSGKHTFQVPAGMKMSASMAEGINYVGQQKQIDLSVTDADGNPVSLDNAVLSFESSNQSVATVDETGLVTFTGKGDATVTAKATFSNVEILGEIVPSVTVEASVSFSTLEAKITSLKLVADKDSIKATQQTQLTLVGTYDDGTEVNFDPAGVTFKSSDESIATVDETGLVTTLKPGDVSFTALTKDMMDEVSASLDISNYAETEMFFDDFETADNFPGAAAANGELFVNKGQKIVYQGGMDWTDYAVETVAKANTNAFSLWFRAKGADANYLWQINEADAASTGKVLLKTHVFTSASTFTQFDNVELGDEYKIGEYNKLKVVVIGNRIMTYINDVLVQEITDSTYSKGSVGFRNGGSESNYYQYLKVSDLALSASCDISVGTPAIADMELVSEPAEAKVGETAQLTLYQVYDTGAKVAMDASKVTFKSSDESVATVDENGVVTVLKAGKVSFTAQTEDGLDMLGSISSDAIGEKEVLFNDEFETADNFPGASASNGVLTVGKGQKILYQGGLNWTDYVVTTTGKADANAWSLWFQGTNATNNYLWQINEKDGAETGTVYLKRHVFKDGQGWSQGFKQFDNIELGDEYKAGEYNTLKVVRIGDQILTYINDVLVDSMTDSNLSAGSVGFRNGSSEVNSYQYIRVATPVLTASVDFTAEENLPAVTVEAIDENGEAITQAVTNELFGVRIVTPDNVTGVRLMNEYGLRISMKNLQRVDNGDGTITWTANTAIGTASKGRTISVYTQTAETDYADSGASFMIDIVLPKPVITSASIEETAVVNVPVTITAVTGKTVTKLMVKNEYGAAMGILSSSYVDMDEGRVWTATIKIGTAGTRSFSVYGKDKTGAVTEAAQTNTVTVKWF